jgi:hypothetical protein
MKQLRREWVSLGTGFFGRAFRITVVFSYQWKFSKSPPFIFICEAAETKSCATPQPRTSARQ